MESFVQEANWLERVIDAWKRVKRAAFQTGTRTNESSNSSAQKTDLDDIKAQVADLAGLVRGLAN
jgi:hypothetical protein